MGQKRHPAAKPRGFAAMSKAKRQEIASLGGRTAHEQGRAHQFTPEEASAASKKGHQARGRKLLAKVEQVTR
jgi:uncharacterized protein